LLVGLVVLHPESYKMYIAQKRIVVCSYQERCEPETVVHSLYFVCCRWINESKIEQTGIYDQSLWDLLSLYIYVKRFVVKKENTIVCGFGSVN